MKVKFVLATVLLSMCGAWAQAPAGSSQQNPEPAIAGDNTPQPDPQRTERSRTLYNGGSNEQPSRNLLTTGFSVRVGADTNPSEMAGAVGTDMLSSLSGFGSLSRDWRTQRLALSYEGGGYLYVRNTQWNADFHHGGLSYEVTKRNWLLNLREEVDYSPGSPLGASRSGSGDGVSGSSTGLGPNDVPNQSILGPVARQLNNTTAGQLDILLGPRNTLTFSGSYGILRTVDDELLGAAQEHGSAGFVRRLSRRNRIGAIFDYGNYRYDALNTTVYTSTAMAYFAHEVGRRVLVQFSIGPQFSHSTIANTSDQGISFDGTANWMIGRSNLFLGYFRGITGGSGVLASAQTDTVSAGFTHPLARRWTLSSSFGYSTNEATATANVLQSGLGHGSFTSTIGRLEVGHDVMRGNRMYLRYSAYKGGRSVCVSSGCSTDELRHVIEFGFDMRFRPIRVM